MTHQNIINIKIEKNEARVSQLLAVQKTYLRGLRPLMSIVCEICDCLIINKQCAAMTLTNHLLESSLKLSLILWKANEKPFDNVRAFEKIYEKEVKLYMGNMLSRNIKLALEETLINDIEGKELTELMLEYRNHIDHASNNKYVRGVETIIATLNLSTGESTENLNAKVTGNPLLYLNAQEGFMRAYAYDYFMRVFSYIMKWDNKIHERYIQNNK